MMRDDFDATSNVLPGTSLLCVLFRLLMDKCLSHRPWYGKGT
jgi:hypothetical protein